VTCCDRSAERASAAGHGVAVAGKPTRGLLHVAAGQGVGAGRHAGGHCGLVASSDLRAAAS
jgi:hypothetical protein